MKPDTGLGAGRVHTDLSMTSRRDPSTPWWFLAVGDKIVVLLVCASIGPALYALILLRQRHLFAGSILGAVWALVEWPVLMTLHNRRIVRLPISLSGTILCVGALAFVVFNGS